jgi:hypothetical protein
MIRLLDFALLSFLVWFVWSQVIRGWRQALAARRGTAPASQNGGEARSRHAAATPESAAALTLVRCDGCGVHVPSARTLPGAAGRVFCSDPCRTRAELRPR